MALTDADARKMPDPDLRRFASAEESDEARSVIIELDVPVAPMAPRSKSPPPRDRMHEADVAASTRAREHLGAMTALEHELTSLGLSEPLVRLNAAQAFVATVSPAQLRAIAGLPLVAVVRPNRTHRTPP